MTRVRRTTCLSPSRSLRRLVTSCRSTSSALADQLPPFIRRLITQSPNLCLCARACVYSRHQDLVRNRLSTTLLHYYYTAIIGTYLPVISPIRRTDYNYCRKLLRTLAQEVHKHRTCDTQLTTLNVVRLHTHSTTVRFNV